MVEEELEGDWVAERDFSLDEIFFDLNEEAQAPEAGRELTRRANGDRRQFDRFLESNVQAQRQQGFSTVEVKVVAGT